MSEKSAFRPYALELAEFFKSAEWPFLVNLTTNDSISGLPVVSEQPTAISRRANKFPAYRCIS